MAEEAKQPSIKLTDTETESFTDQNTVCGFGEGVKPLYRTKHCVDLVKC